MIVFFSNNIYALLSLIVFIQYINTGPILEDAAINSGGMFRLCKVNSDSQGSIAQTFGVNSLPTVFAINSGKVLDRFIGMLPTEQLQQFLVRSITGKFQVIIFSTY